MKFDVGELISPHRCNVSPLRTEKPQNQPPSNLNTGVCAMRAIFGKLSISSNSEKFNVVT